MAWLNIEMATIWTHVTGASAVVASLYCIWLNGCHIYLSKHSEYRKTRFGKKLQFWSHLSMIFVSLSPIFMLLSYTHIESFKIFEWIHNDCLCAFWVALSMASFETGFVFLCVNYLIRLNLVLNPTNPDKKSPVIIATIIFLVMEAIAVDITMFFSTHGECNKHHQVGCNTTMDLWGM